MPFSSSENGKQFAVLGNSILFFNSSDRKAYLNWMAVGLLFHPKQLQILEKTSQWHLVKICMLDYSQMVNLPFQADFAYCKMECAETQKPITKVFLRPWIKGKSFASF